MASVATLPSSILTLNQNVLNKQSTLKNKSLKSSGNPLSGKLRLKLRNHFHSKSTGNDAKPECESILASENANAHLGRGPKGKHSFLARSNSVWPFHSRSSTQENDIEGPFSSFNSPTISEVENIPEESLTCYQKYKTDFTDQGLSLRPNDVYSIMLDGGAVDHGYKSGTGYYNRQLSGRLPPLGTERLCIPEISLTSPNSALLEIDRMKKARHSLITQSSKQSVAAFVNMTDLFEDDGDEMTIEMPLTPLEPYLDFDAEIALYSGDHESDCLPSGRASRSDRVFSKMRIAFNRINSFSHKDTFSTTSPDGSLSPVSIFVPIFRDKKDDISCIVENLATGTIQEEDLMNESFISSNTCDAPLNFKDPRFYNVDPEEDTLHELGPNPESPEYSKIKFEKFAQLLLYDGNGKCSKRPKSMSTSTINSETVAEGSLKRKRGSRKSYDGLASPSRSNSIKRIKRLSSRMSRTNETEENITPSVEVEGEAGEMDYSTIKSILKARVNTNLEQESFRAERCDEVDVDDFIEYFESHERKKSEAEPFLGKIRKSQISQYYTDLVSPGCV